MLCVTTLRTILVSVLYIPLQSVVISLPSTSNPEEIRQTIMIGQPDVANSVMPQLLASELVPGVGVRVMVCSQHMS